MINKQGIAIVVDLRSRGNDMENLEVRDEAMTHKANSEKEEVSQRQLNVKLNQEDIGGSDGSNTRMPKKSRGKCLVSSFKFQSRNSKGMRCKLD